MISIEGLNKSYNGNQILKNVNIKIAKGEIHGLVGKSGAGKSTLLRCINGLERYEEGHIVINGVDISQSSKSEIRHMRRKMGMIFQNYSLIEYRTVYQNVALPMKCWKYPKKEINKKVTELLDIIDLSEKMTAYPKALSGGQKQRVAIARALTMDPEILLCDEATSALDPHTTKSVLELIDKVNKEMGITIVIVTHQMDVVRTICDTVSILENGCVVDSGTVTEIFLKNPPSLCKLLGTERITFPKDRQAVSFLTDQKNGFVITELSRKIDEDILILSADNANYHGTNLMLYTVQVSFKNVEKLIMELETRQFEWYCEPNYKGGV